MRLGWVACAALCLGFGGLARGQDTLDPAALQAAAQTMADQRLDADWLTLGRDRFIACARPVPPAGILRATIEVEDVLPDISVAPLSEADQSGGLMWAEIVTYEAARSREYDAGRGWSAWRQAPLTLAVIQTQLVEGQWVVEEESGLMPATVECRRPAARDIAALKPD